MLRKVTTSAVIAAFTLATTPGFACTGRAADAAKGQIRTIKMGLPAQPIADDTTIFTSGKQAADAGQEPCTAPEPALRARGETPGAFAFCGRNLTHNLLLWIRSACMC
jgi:tryptophan synthase alpha subunit